MLCAEILNLNMAKGDFKQKIPFGDFLFFCVFLFYHVKDWLSKLLKIQKRTAKKHKNSVKMK